MENKRTFFIADTHFGDSNIIKYENRPFSDINEMEKIFIGNWNNIVEPQDKVFVLGDFSLYDKNKTAEICNRLKGRKTLVLGNHDEETPRYYMECGFEFVSEYPIILDDFWILSHEPMYVNDNMPYANIFGHVHSSKIYTDCTRQSFCACVERLEYKPVEFSRVKRLMGVGK